MNELERVDNYMNGLLPPDERRQFEEAIHTDSELAEALAFYLSSREAARQEARQQRKAELDARRHRTNPGGQEGGAVRPLLTRPLRRWTYAAAAASLALLVGLGWYFQNRSLPDTEIADAYISQNLTQIPPSMDAAGDSLQLGLRYFNEGKLTEAGVVFEGLLQRNPNATDALKFAGLVSLRTGRYDKAIEQFHQLGQRTDLYANPGAFYEALARLRRSGPGDKAIARNLLQTVVDDKLEGADDARKMLEKLD